MTPDSSQTDGAIEQENKKKWRRRTFWTLLLLLLFMTSCSILEGSSASVITMVFKLSGDMQKLLEGGASGGPLPVPPGLPPPEGALPGDEAGVVLRVGAPAGNVPGAVPVTQPPVRGAPGTDIAGGIPAVPGVTAPARSSARTTSSSSIAITVSSSSAVSVQGSTSSSGLVGTTAGQTGGEGGTTGSGPDLSRPPLPPQFFVKLINSSGKEFDPKFHFEGAVGRLTLDERRFTPGFYTLRVTRFDPNTNFSQSAEQELAWGVLAMNTDKDRYRPGEQGLIDFGVLDEEGKIVCDAVLTLTITAPDGTKKILTTSDNSIEVTGTCGLKVAGLIDPDYRAIFDYTQQGTYHLHLLAVRPDTQIESEMDSDVQVQPAPPYIVKRTAATRLWPLAPSTMTIDVEFLEDFTGIVTDIVPDGFDVLQTAPLGSLSTSGTDRLISWTGVWEAGETQTFFYEYDAPDISPEFYLVGPLKFADSEGGSEELRAWQIANDDVARSNSYNIGSDVVASGGGEDSRSSNYMLADTLGEPNIGPSRSNTYALDAGYRQTTAAPFLSIDCDNTVSLGSISLYGQKTGTTTCTAITDAEAGYTLSWRVSTGSGGTNTGYLISALEHTIAPFSVAVAGTPETWAITAATSEWGGRLKSTSTDADAKWGVDASSEKWLNVGTGSYVVVSRATRTSVAGSTESIQFRTEVGATRNQPAGTYQTDVTITIASQ